MGADASPRIVRLGPDLLPEDGEVFDLEDALPGVHVLLTGTTGGGAGRLGFLADDAVGDATGAGRVLMIGTVAAIADAIESIQAKVVRQRLDSDALASVPPFSGRRLDDDDKEWLLAVLQGLMLFVRRAAADGLALRVDTGDRKAS